MNNNFDLTNMPNDVYLNAEGDDLLNPSDLSDAPNKKTAKATTGTASCGKEPFFAGKRKNAYKACMTKEQEAAAAKEASNAAELASAKALAESAAAQVHSLQADADMKKADSANALAEAQALKDAADAAAKKKADLADNLKGKAAISKEAAAKLEADRAAIAAGKDSGTNWFMWGVVVVAVVIGAKMLMKAPKAVTA